MTGRQVPMGSKPLSYLNNQWVFWSVVTAMLLGLPLAGVFFSANPLGRYLEFPPSTRYIQPAAFSAWMFILFGLIDLILIAGLAALLLRAKARKFARPVAKHPFPLWGWFGLVLMLFGWYAAWSRLAWLQPLQEQTFCLPWGGYILLVNAWCCRRSGRSLLTDCPKRFAGLFAISALFWWFFEYLNRFVQNWHYVGAAEYGALAYILLASLAFATVLPAVLSTHRLLLTFAIFNPGLAGLRGLPGVDSPATAWIMLLAAAAALTLLGLYPDFLFATVWFAPLLILVGLRRLSGRRTLFSPLVRGDWRPIAAATVAALICGFFWELWNYHSLVRWEYAVPYVDRYHIFAMPILGYGGYLPFGLECLAVGQVVMGDSPLNISHAN
jgi:hypothetical protein